MAHAHHIVIRNTFINVLDIGEQRNDAIPRQVSAPLPVLDDVEPRRHNDVFDPYKDDPSELEFLNLSPGCNQSEASSCGQSEKGFDDTLGSDALDNSVSRADSSSCASVACVGGHGIEEAATPKHQDIPAEWHGKTSVMVRNISYKCTRTDIIEELNKSGFEKLFDYVYMPLNVRRGTGKGYAFVNFLDAYTAYRFKEHFDGLLMDVLGGVKRLEVIPANLQGYSQNISHYIAKQSESSAAVKVSAPQSPPESIPSEDVRSGIVDQVAQPPRKAIAAPRQKDNLASTSCHKCHGRVLRKARFCQWCGVGL
eukprot:TRINITY_DN6258_c0_g3_i1.p1 TRINITY_DN6258_c0_g3~~TRINITY_DN6258_c0_g3_i1.p1  ORF type:complete len:331 (+),score=24.78 TRINITY_DN6258_c0_g3_i1:66-995(+)